MFDFLFYGKRILRQLEIIDVKLTDLDEALGLVGDQLAKAKIEIVAKQDELLAKIAELEVLLEDVDVPDEVEAVLESLKVKAQELDDIVPDGPVV